MKILAENANRDLFKASNNQLTLLTGIVAVEQACKSAIEAQRGEMQYATTRGIPTAQTVWNGIPNQQRFQFYCLEALRAIDGVVKIDQFNTELSGQNLLYEAIIVTDFGAVVLGGLV